MMMDYLGRKNNDDDLVAIGRLIDDSVADHLKDGKMRTTYDLDVGISIADRFAQGADPPSNEMSA